MPPKKRPKRRSRKRVQTEPIEKRVSVIDDSDNWIECVMTAVWNLLDQQIDGAACITTPGGQACRIWVQFGKAGEA